MNCKELLVKHVIETKNDGRWTPVLDKRGGMVGFGDRSEATAAMEFLFSKRFVNQTERRMPVSVRVSTYVAGVA